MTDNTARSLVAEDLPLREEIVRGLNGSPPALPSRLFYDDRGARLFERICTLPEYYPTRCELEILARALPEIAANLGPGCEVIEPGSGEGIKTRRLLAALDAPRLYQPLDVAAEQLREAAARLRTHFPALTVVPVVADFTKPLHLPAAVGRRVFFFPGSTIGNFPPQMAEELLASWHADAGPEGQLLIGVDLRKDPQVLHAAYNDAAGVTAAFNRNILRHINRRIGSDFLPENWAHDAPYDDATGQVQMWLRAQGPQRVNLGDGTVREFADGESIRTEFSCKYAIAEFQQLAARAGWRSRATWTDARDWFSVQLFQADGSSR